MLDTALAVLRDELNAFIATRSSSYGQVALTGIVDEEGRYAFADESLALCLLGLEEGNSVGEQYSVGNPIAGQQQARELELRFALSVMIAASFKSYELALKHISWVIHFFQAHPVFTPDQTPALGPHILELVVDLQSPSYEELHRIWSFVGARQLPSVVYTVRMEARQDLAQNSGVLPIPQVARISRPKISPFPTRGLPIPVHLDEPDVYEEDMPALPPSVAGVPSAVPAFVGYTEKARRDADNDLILEPTKIHSLDEYEQSFGVAGSEQVSIAVERTPAADYRTTSLLVGGATPHDSLLPSYLLYYAVRMFFENGGGPCFIVSVGTYGAGAPTVELYGGTAASSAARDLRDGLDRLALEDEITLIVIPEAVKLDAPQYGGMVQAVLDQCGRLGDRFGIFDIVAAGGTLEADLVTARTAFGTDHLQFGAAYYPFVRTALTYGMDETTVAVSLEIDGDSESASAPVKLDNLRATDPSLYSFVKTALNEHHIIMPPSGAVAGAYAATDAAKGVWTAPANIALAGVIEPVVLVDDAQQEKLNIDPSTGKSINAIRYFPGKGSLVWGARTLAGNDPEWRYIPVRRFFNMVGESVGQSTRWAMSDPNDANTWLRVRSMIEDYLARLWRDGALVGTTPDEAYFVRCGLGATMTTDDVRQGRIIVEIGMAVVRPAEFTTLKISHEQPPT